jgi:hypothetical protein
MGINTVNKRPNCNYLIYRANKSNLKKQFQKVIYPKSMLLQAGYGNRTKHARQFIPNFYMLGAKAHWNVFDWDKSKKKRGTTHF